MGGPQPAARPSSRGAFYLLFTASGFSGLIYQSIWSHYLKLFLGHAAYAQSLVLITFMGGMAVGSWISSRWSHRWRNLLLAYAIAEGVIGLLGVVFHQVFVAGTGFAYEAIIPALGGSPAAVTGFKWALSALLILPQSILLGMTFPLMAGGMIRLHPAGTGSTLSLLYFTNSFGAAVGVLASGFFLIERVGLPGTILTAGLLNLALALVVWGLVKFGRAPDAAPAAREAGGAGPVPALRLLLVVSLLTGAASFIYEIAWIRMLSMVLGASTHAFELMLSAFILGLALGGLWIRKRIDAFADPQRFLGYVQVVMGICALGTLFVYDLTYGWMEWLLSAISRTDSGYAVFNVSSHLVALAVMLPASFCAGTTLPLITHSLMKSGAGERAIGAVYSANTVGAILGVLLAVHVGLPLLGLKGLLVFGAGIDIALGVVLLGRISGRRLGADLATAAGAAALLATVLLGPMDAYKMASGVFRHGKVLHPRSAQIDYHRDGKTATVSLVRRGDTLSLLTNGKPDAAVNMGGKGPPRPDELAQVLSAALPLAAHPAPRTAANIGFGSGRTSHVLLTSPELREVDSIEIEPFIVEAARRFQPRNELAYKDPRSRIHYEDAKTFFSLHGKRYDIIISEPSNPWVSGTASLFTEEFYGLVKRHLNEGGVFAQWLQMYEISPALVGTVLKALERHFPDYELYAATDIDFIVLARREGAPRLAPERLFGDTPLGRELRRVEIHAAGDLDLHRAGGAAAFRAYIESLRVPANSDFFPVLEFRAPKARFIGESVGFGLELAIAPIPVMEMLSGGPVRDAAASAGSRPWLHEARRREAARSMVDDLLGPRAGAGDGAPAPLEAERQLVRMLLVDCQRPDQMARAGAPLFAVASYVVPVLRPGELRPLWDRIAAAPCHGAMPAAERRWMALYAAVSARDAAGMVRESRALLEGGGRLVEERAGYAVAAALAGMLAQGDRAGARDLWLRLAPLVGRSGGPQIDFLVSQLPPR
jgi:predicted membrane-bound spermidine synthase